MRKRTNYLEEENQRTVRDIKECRCMNFTFAKHQNSSEEEVQVPCTGIKERMETPNEVMKMRRKYSANKEWH